MDVTLSEEMAAFVEAKVSAGQYGSATDVIRDALHLLEASDPSDAAIVASLRAAWQEGIDSGDAGEIDFAALKAEARARLARAKE